MPTQSKTARVILRWISSLTLLTLVPRLVPDEIIYDYKVMTVTRERSLIICLMTGDIRGFYIFLFQATTRVEIPKNSQIYYANSLRTTEEAALIFHGSEKSCNRLIEVLAQHLMSSSRTAS